MSDTAPSSTTQPPAPSIRKSSRLSMTTTLTTASESGSVGGKQRLRRSMSAVSTLDELKLSHVLNGETCPPISFPDFAAFISQKEFSSENLLFIIWFRSYKSRWDALPDEVRQAVPIPSIKLGDRYRPFAYLDRAIEEGRVQSRQGSVDVSSSSSPPSPAKDPGRSGVGWEAERQFKPCQWAADGKCHCGNASHEHSAPRRSSIFGIRSQAKGKNQEPPRPILHHTSLDPPLPPPGTVLLDPREQPMRDEARRAFATFLKGGGSRELGVADELRQFVKECLKRSCAPEVFLPVFEDIYQIVETQSLPHFLSYARTNINRPKQLFWYIVGTIDFLIGLALFLGLTLGLKTHPWGLRATRLPSVIFVAFGSMQFYSAARGFCSQVWGRSSRQVRPWEMDDIDEEAILSGARASHHGGSADSSATGPRGSSVAAPLREPSEKLSTTDCDLAGEVHPLSDMSGVMMRVSSSADKGDWESASMPVLLERSDVVAPIQLGPEVGVSEGGDTMTAIEKRQLEIRRATVKAPSPEEAFPVFDSMTSPLVVTSPLIGGTSTARHSNARTASLGSPAQADSGKRSEISPFDVPDDGPIDPLVPPPGTEMSMGATQIQQEDLAALLSRYTLGVSRASGEGAPEDLDKPAKIFGPERVVEDPRVRALFESVIRDILIVGGVSACVWITLCLAVPMAGLR